MAQVSTEDAGESAQTDLKPGCRLTVGITGHRRHKLPAEHWPRIEAAVATQLSSLRETAAKSAQKHASAFASAPLQLRLVTPLADGADTLAATLALQQGYRIEACLPFARAEYAKDFSGDASRTSYESLLDRCAAVFELDGDREEAEAAYETVGKVLLDQADILIAAVGVPQFVKGNMVKPGAVVVDVGINSVSGKLVGDVEAESVSAVAGWLSPVPGGVGPMTITMLLHNTLKAAILLAE